MVGIMKKKIMLELKVEERLIRHADAVRRDASELVSEAVSDWLDAMQGTTKRRATIEDIARIAGVSNMAAHYALRYEDSPRVGDEKRKEIREIAKKMKWRPNPFAMAMRQCKTRAEGNKVGGAGATE
jgi:hypothetical protein